MSIEEIRGRLEAATPGEWTAWDRGIGYEVHVNGEELNSGFRETFSRRDAEFIAHAPEDMRRLLNAVEAVEGWMQNLDAVERAKPTDPNDLNCSARDVARNVRAAIRAALEAS